MATDPAPEHGAPRWLEPDERTTWLRIAAFLSRLPAELDLQLQRDSDLTFFEYSVLAVLGEVPGGALRMSDLAFLSRGSPSRLSHVAAKLEKAGLLERRRSEQDGRHMLATLTPAGRDRVRTAAPGHVDHVRRLVIDRLTSEQLAALRDALDVVLAGLDPDQPWPPTPPPGIRS